MKEYFEVTNSFKKLLQKYNAEEDSFEIIVSFGNMNSKLNELNNENINKKLESIEENLILLDEKEEIKKVKFRIAMNIGEIENLLNEEDLEKQSVINIDRLKQKKEKINPAVVGTIASMSTLLMRTSPLGILAAGLLGTIGAKVINEQNRAKATTADLLVIGYYLSMYDHEGIFGEGISSAKAIESIAFALNVNANTLRGKRDYFDSIIPQEKRKSKRKGYSDIKSTAVYDAIIEEYSNYDENKVRNEVISIIEKYIPAEEKS